MPRPSDPTSLGDGALMSLVREGDERALGVLYDRHSPLVFSLARTITGGDADAEEVTEDVFVQLWTSAERYDPDRGALRAYLATVARSRALDHVRARKRRRAAHERAAERDEQGVAVTIADVEPTDAPAQRADVRARLDGALEVLNDDQRRAIELAYFQGFTQSEIAEHLGEPLGTVKTRLRDGMGKLRERFGGSGGWEA